MQSSKRISKITFGHANWAIIFVLIAAAFLHVFVWAHSVPRDAAKRRDWGAIRFHDEKNYYVHTAEAVTERGWSYLSDEESLRSPPIPWVWLLIWNRSVVVARIANVALVLVGAFLVGRIARPFGGQIWTTLFAATGYQTAYYSGTVLTEPLAFFFVCLALWAFDGAVRKRSFGWICLVGLATALAAYSRPSLQPWPVALMGLVLVASVSRRGKTQVESTDRPHPKWTTALCILLVHVALLAPWLIKNKVDFGVARIANGLGAVMLLGSELTTNADEPGFSGMQWPNLPVQGPKGHMSLDGEARLKKAAVEKIKARPWAWGKMGFVKLGRFFIGGPQWHFQPGRTLIEARQQFHPTRAVIRYLWWTVGGTFVTVYGLAGLIALFRRGEPIALAAVSLIATLAAVHIVTYSMPRFAVPILPALAIGAGYGLLRFGWKSHALLIIISLCAIATVTFWHANTVPSEISHIAHRRIRNR